MKQTSLKSGAGFTLIELIVTIFIITLIAGVSVANYRKGERSRQAAIAADGVIGAFNFTQNLTLSGRQTSNNNASCRTAAYYFLRVDTSTNIYEVKARNICAGDDLIETYSLPGNVRFREITADATSYVWTETRFALPFGQITFDSDLGVIPGNPTLNIVVETLDGSVSRTITVDSVTGRIDQ
ncbi:MAG: hypothetical protein A3I07_01340 [Candidatus Doudnabacteria bacterium RIFCSPLOWO2_02_FULL_42_9]|uniref:General secretion pathway GspH domain-containing protein n=1 Tax=Candidatus Doudnabacteria bacterium RIFCSPHIGHO2_01_FULL_41_86 TaxID=1817821 RepID=A0A1F5N8V4_9BACT|nr:MAG: hypothetical protein A2717_00900 [Candidatus Doudnabacteria bacterium RIFCSPHIGHO2_01_FULL_41_86]OGE75401.1 MAG: hypothetical protein A3K07_01415 [Candidatus Doudnabacteria bacterium RIFCSPHIGHO2_01_43_10]OGE86573.1 MAG: hypothetical protein A3E28_04155 [Candidatus Doudnabacteria bacterium RIFCSPHIGHO2_12_FULL_42_22]OGE87473.1 MAG: hypothetical protein A3C49_03815 [Candidatus Doudnabacteria bacterium RIFCSPHIGHO2_02_FULL_42_25]OGE92792.1 MAG: hypothetical protein A2895_04700 [Candidatus